MEYKKYGKVLLEESEIAKAINHYDKLKKIKYDYDGYTGPRSTVNRKSVYFGANYTTYSVYAVCHQICYLNGYIQKNLHKKILNYI